MASYLFQLLCFIIWVTFPPLGIVVGLFFHMFVDKSIDEMRKEYNI